MLQYSVHALQGGRGIKNMGEKNKVVLLGDCGVGKTTLFTRFKSGIFVENMDKQKRAEAEHQKTITVDGEDITITLYDTAGMERIEGTVPPTYFRNAKAIILVYSVGNNDSIDNIVDWAASVTPERFEYLGSLGEVFRALVGNKIDLEKKERVVDMTRATDTAEICRLNEDLVFEVSAKTGEGVDEMFEAIARKILKSGKADNIPRPPLPPPRKSCCGAS